MSDYAMILGRNASAFAEKAGALASENGMFLFFTGTALFFLVFYTLFLRK
ncbi:MAG: hypothetical protein AAFW81_00945 [Pseudomonadota bacterium]